MGYTSDKVTEYLSSHYKPLDDDLAEFRLYNEENNVPLILRETESLLALLIEMILPALHLMQGSLL